MKLAVFMELDRGGANRAGDELAGALRRKGHQVDLFSVGERIDDSEKIFYDRCFRFEFHPVKWSGKDWKSRIYRDTFEIIKLFFLHRRIARKIETEDYNFVLVHSSKFTQAPWILRCLKLQKVFYCHEPLRIVYDPLFKIPNNLNLAKRTYEKLIRAWRKWIDIINIRRADVLLTNSRYTQQSILKAYGLRASICHLGVDTRFFFPKAKKRVDILFIGSKNEWDGYSLFKESLSRLQFSPKVKYLIQGRKWITESQLRRLYSEAELVICFGFNEPFGLIPLESMACGSTPLALDEGGYRDSVQSGRTGMLVPRDPQLIAEVITKLLRSRSKLKRMQVLGLEEMRDHWTWEKAAERILLVSQRSHNRRTVRAHFTWVPIVKVGIGLLLLTMTLRSTVFGLRLLTELRRGRNSEYLLKIRPCVSQIGLSEEEKQLANYRSLGKPCGK